jgi:RHS repeat-associated protein
VIEERDAGDVLVRYHVNGTQYLDERVATYTETGGKQTGQFTYYLLNDNLSIAGTGNADGSEIVRLDYSSGGDFGGGPTVLAHDADEDGDVDSHDFGSLQLCFGTVDPDCLAAHDFDINGDSDGVIDAADWEGFEQCFSGPDVSPPPGCQVSRSRNGNPLTGTFALHGRPIDVLSDGKVLYYFRARYYDPAHAHWLQRDPTGYADGGNLYEAFKNNAGRFKDPFG